MRRDQDVTKLAYLSVLPAATHTIRQPDATLGWSGDPDLTVAWNGVEDRIEVWRLEGRETPSGYVSTDFPILRAPNGTRPTETELIRELVSRDGHIAGQTMTDQFEKLIRSVEQEERDRDRADFERLRPTHEKLVWTLAKENEGVNRMVSLGTYKKDA